LTPNAVGLAHTAIAASDFSTFMLGREISNRPYPEIGVSDSHHPLSHHQDKPVNLERLHKINHEDLPIALVAGKATGIKGN
jgi:hypothetical protein